MQAFKIPPFAYVHKRTRTARPRLKGFIQLLFTLSYNKSTKLSIVDGEHPTLPHESLLDYGQYYYPVFLDTLSILEKPSNEGRGFRPSFSVKRFFSETHGALEKRRPLLIAPNARLWGL